MKKKMCIFALFVLLATAYSVDALECMFCHQYSWNASNILYPPINQSLFGFHIDINSTSGPGNLTSDDCMTCHYSANTQAFHGPSVSTYACEECHITGIVPSAPQVSNHKENANITVNASCSDCHNKTSNLFEFSVNASAAHYGRNASFGLPPGEPYCAYCHENSSTVYRDMMQNQNNNMLGNHTSGIINAGHPAGRPDCTTCHGSDRIHGPNLTKPVPDSVFCNNCHQNDRLQKNKHAGNVECIRCHTDTSSDIHNIKYILPDGTYRSVNATTCGNCHNFSLSPPFFRLQFSPADCTTCHLGNGLVRFSDAPRFQMKHSSNPGSGRLWNGSQPAYWGDQLSSCKYCHMDSLHDTNAAGNITNIQAGNALNQSITNTSFWCANCHYQGVPSGNYSYNATSLDPIPPEIQNKSGLVPARASDGSTFYNHSLGGYSDAACLPCHAVNFPSTTAFFIHNVSSGGGGPDCISCHDTGGPAPKLVDFRAANETGSVHKNLNANGVTNLNRSNLRCWACHGDGDGSQSAQPASGHPLNYKNPRNCSNNDCHSLSQSIFQEPMAYSHFKNAGRNSNPGNMTNYNITTSAGCETCHINSIVTDDGNPDIAKVSHYGSRDKLLDSFNCIYCHLFKNNSEDWGNATLINKNRTALIEFDREKNKFTLFEGDSLYLGEGYSVELAEISNKREEAFIRIFFEDIKVDEVSLVTGSEYKYEKKMTIDNSTFRTPFLTLNITAIFKGGKGYVQFEGSRIRKVHTESRNSACYACHRQSENKERYIVIDKEYDEDFNKDIIYLSRVFVDFSLENKSKIYFNDENYVFNQIESDFGRHMSFSPLQQLLKEGESWSFSNGYSLEIKEVSTDSNKVWLALMINNSIVDDRVVALGSIYDYRQGIRYKEYTQTNVTLFSANISSIVQGNENFVLLKDVIAISPDVSKITGNTTFSGYNGSWLKPNDTITTGKIPPDLHSPLMFTDQRNWADCVNCHDSSKNLRIPDVDAISSRLGKHFPLNGKASNISFISDPIDKACWACHTNGKEPKSHSPTYIVPVDCKSCHVYRSVLSFGAINISDEPHANEPKCEICHIAGSHVLERYQVLPTIREASLSRTVVNRSETVELSANAMGGYKMKIRGVEYFMDKTGSSGTGIHLLPDDGKFDSQNENVNVKINTRDISNGEHVIYVHAMERDNKWGVFYTLDLNVTNPIKSSGTNKKSPDPGSAAFLIVMALAYLMISGRSRKR